MGHTSHHLLKSSLCLWGEILAQVMGHHNHNHITHLEVLRIHMQLVTVQLTETCKGALEVVEVFQAITKGINHLLAMCLHFSIAHNSRCRGQVPKGVKEPLGPWVDNQQPEGVKRARSWNIVSACQRYLDHSRIQVGLVSWLSGRTFLPYM
uniref:Uncharacterized protein n=1 Tax=Marmota marmota marmota TaxID=9994 RepID=A0A8C5ZKP4_MARMA